MYDPKGNGKDRAVDAVAFTEVEPPAYLQGVVHRFLELKTSEPLTEDYRFHALPDACTYIVFDQLDPRIMGLARLRAASEEFNLGRAFHFVNIRLMPGVWQGDPAMVTPGVIDSPYTGDLPLAEVNEALAGKSLDEGQPVLVTLVEDLMGRGLLQPSPITECIFQHLDDIHSVADMARVSGISARQLQRTLKRITGFAPHDFLKVLRLQQALNGSDTWS
nr:AraC family transcriptional regulator [Paracoccaceae bacterium]